MSSINAPEITVLMSVFNGEDYLSRAIDSILTQTFNNFEFIIINDGSTDNSSKIISRYNDPRIIVHDNITNMGLSASLNLGIKMSRGRYIARMDSDDISLPTRLEEQYQFLEKNPKIGLCGTYIQIIGSDIIWKYPSNPEEIRAGLLFHTQFAHPSVMFRRTLFEHFNLSYDESFEIGQDYELWVRCSHCFPMSNVKKVLLLYRIYELNSTHAKKELRENTLKRIYTTQFQISYTYPSEEIIDFFYKFVNREQISLTKYLKIIELIDMKTDAMRINKILVINEIKKISISQKFPQIYLIVNADKISKNCLLLQMHSILLSSYLISKVFIISKIAFEEISKEISDYLEKQIKQTLKNNSLCNEFTSDDFIYDYDKIKQNIFLNYIQYHEKKIDCSLTATMIIKGTNVPIDILCLINAPFEYEKIQISISQMICTKKDTIEILNNLVIQTFLKRIPHTLCARIIMSKLHIIQIFKVILFKIISALNLNLIINYSKYKN